MSLSQELWHIGVNVPGHSNYDPADNENIRQMYIDYFGYNRLIPAATVALHGLMSTFIKPDRSFGPEADGKNVGERTKEWLADGKALIVIADHQHYNDHFVDVAAIRGVPELREITERGRPLAKVEYFNNGEDSGFADRVIGMGYRILGAIPIYRPKDLERMIAPASTPEKTIERNKIIRNGVLITNKAAESACIEYLGDGGILHIYAEGERKTENWAEVSTFGDLTARLLKKAEAEGIEVAVLVMARSYGVKREHKWYEINLRSPHVRFEALLEGPFDDKAGTNARMRNTMQSGLNQAHTNKRAVNISKLRQILERYRD